MFRRYDLQKFVEDFAVDSGHKLEHTSMELITFPDGGKDLEEMRVYESTGGINTSLLNRG
jgi:hypothetical protein